MPTGYTAKLMESGESFQEFAMTCARAFGALVLMRDDPMDAPIRDFEPSPYYQNSLTEHTSELARLNDMSADEKQAHGEILKASQIKTYEDWLQRDQAANIRIDAMIAEVNKWEPPTPEHVGLRDFMLEQLKISRNDVAYIKNELAKAKAKPASIYFVDELDSHDRGIEYARMELAKEIQRTNERNLWVKNLRESLQVTNISG